MTAAGFPALQSLVAFTSDYTDTTPSWDDVSGYLLAFSTHRGRAPYDGSFDTGTMDQQLDNTDGRFDPENTSGPYSGYILPMRRCRLVATIGGNAYPIFTGYSGDWWQTWPGGADHCVTAVSALDRFKIFDWTEDDSNTRPDEDADVRIEAVLQHAGIGAGDRIINADAFAARSMKGETFTNFNVLQMIQDSANGDGGQLFIDPYGQVVYQTVKYRQIGGSTRARTSQARIGNDATSIPAEVDLTRGIGDSTMANRVSITAWDGTVKVAEDTALQGSIGPRFVDLGGSLLMPTDAEDRVNDELALRKNPTPRYPSASVNLLTLSAADQETILGLEISDRVTIAVIPPGHTTGVERDQWIESIDHNVTIAGGPAWTVTFGLSSAGDAATAIP